MSRLLSSTAPDALLGRYRVAPRWRRARYTVSWSEKGPRTGGAWQRRFFVTDSIERMEPLSIAEMVRERMDEGERHGTILHGLKVEENH